MSGRSPVHGFWFKLLSFNLVWLSVKGCLIYLYWWEADVLRFEFLLLWRPSYLIMEAAWWVWAAKSLVDWMADDYRLSLRETSCVVVFSLANFYAALITAAAIFGVFAASDNLLVSALSLISFANGNAVSVGDTVNNEWFFLCVSMFSYLMLAIVIGLIFAVLNHSES